MLRSPMTDEDTPRDEIETELVPLPLCDEEDEHVASAQESAPLVSSEGDVEGHGSWGVGDSA